MVEMYEGSGRYKDVRELYESKLEAKETELMSAKESLIQVRMKEEQKVKELASMQSEIQNVTKLHQSTTEKTSETITTLEDKLR